MQRHLLSAADTGTQTDTGAPMSGEIRQMSWKGDTGVTLRVTLIANIADTGDGFDIYNRALSHGHVVFAPTIPEIPRAGADTGDDYAHPVAAGERLKLTATAKGTAVVNGKLYVWTRD
jgi:hypothetical protein